MPKATLAAANTTYVADSPDRATTTARRLAMAHAAIDGAATPSELTLDVDVAQNYAAELTVRITRRGPPSNAGWIYLSIAKTSSRSSRPSGSASDVRPTSSQPERRESAMAACDDSTTSSTGTRCCVTGADRPVCSSA